MKLPLVIEAMRILLGMALWAAVLWLAYKNTALRVKLKNRDLEVAKLKERQLELKEAGAMAVSAWYELNGSYADEKKRRDLSDDLDFGASYSVFYTDKPYRPKGKTAREIYNKQRIRYGYSPIDPQA